MRTIVIAFLALFLATAGCGENGEPLLPDLSGPPTVPFFLGDAIVDFYGHRLDFGGLGAPSDGFLVCLEDVDMSLPNGLTAWDEIFTARFDEAQSPRPPFDVEFNSWGHVSQIPLPNGGFGWDLFVQLPFQRTGDAVEPVKPGENILYTVAGGTAHIETVFDGAIDFGLADTGLSIALRGTPNNNFGIDYSVDIARQPDAPVVEKVLILIGGNIIEDLGPVTDTVGTNLIVQDGEVTFPISVRFITAADQFSDDIQVDFVIPLLEEIEQTVTETRTYSLPFASEAIFSESRTMFGRTHPALPPTALGEFAMTVYGEGFVEALSKPLPAMLQQIDSGASPAAGTTYDGGTIGLKGNSSYGRNSRQVTPPVVAARIMVGSWGISIANFNNTTNTFDAPTLAEAGNMTDYSPFDGDPESGNGVYCDNTNDAIKFISRDAMNQYVIAPAATITNTAYPNASGKVVSAFRHSSGDLLFVTDGEPGELWVLPNGATTATKVDDVFAAPRRVRAAGNIAAVTCFGGVASFGGMKVFVRSAAGTWSGAPFGLLGTRSVGCDMKVLPDNRVAIAYTNISDDTARIVVTEADGQFSFSNDFFLPGGVEGPGHCSFCEGTSNGLWVSANTSQHAVLMPVFFSPP